MHQKNEERNDFIYCIWHECPHKECLRHHINIPYNVIITRRKFNPNKNWECEGYLP